MTGGLLRGTPGDNIGATPTGVTGMSRVYFGGVPLELIFETLPRGAVPSVREQIEGHLSALRSLLKEHNGRGNVSNDTEDQPRVQTIVTGTVVDVNMKKPFKEASVRSHEDISFMELIMTGTGPKRFSDKVPNTVDEMMTRLEDFVRSEEAFASTELPKGEVSEASKKQWGRELDEGTHLVPSFVSRGRVGRTTRYRGSYGGISGPKCVHRSGGLARGNVRTLLQKLEPRDEVAVEEHIDGSSRLR
ncbi:hypothetical protein Tco_0862156, partial [Tanacetum coccineum]